MPSATGLPSASSSPPAPSLIAKAASSTPGCVCTSQRTLSKSCELTSASMPFERSISHAHGGGRPGPNGLSDGFGKSRTCFPDFASQSFTVRSLDPEARYRPSFVNASANTWSM